MNTIPAIFEKLCPNCYGEISSDRLEKGLPCEKCLPDESLDVCQYIKKGGLRDLCDIEEKLSNWQKHFETYIHSSPWSLQNTWAKRVFLKHSFVLLAPTGIGKTSFGISMASFLIKEDKRCYILLPTKILVKQVYEKVKNFGVSEKDILAIGLEKNNKEKEYNKEKLKSGDFKILITTSMFLYKNFDIYPKDFDFIFVDDVDSFVKTAKNIDKALYIMGFTEKDINTALEIIKLKAKPNKTNEDWDRINQLSQYLSKQKEKIKGVFKPFTKDVAENISKNDYENIFLLPLYPQYSISTTGSSVNEWNRHYKKDNSNVVLIENYYKNEKYIDAVLERINQALNKFHDKSKVYLLFSAHGIPVSYVKKGDPYQKQIEETVELVVNRGKFTNPYSLAYQSKVGPMKWLEPSTDKEIERLINVGYKNLLVIPIAFVSDHIETLYELDIEYRHIAKENGVENYIVSHGLNDSDLFIEALKEEIWKRL